MIPGRWDVCPAGEGLSSPLSQSSPLFILLFIMKDRGLLLIILFFLLLPVDFSSDSSWISGEINNKLTVNFTAGENELEMQSNFY